MQPNPNGMVRLRMSGTEFFQIGQISNA